MRYYVFDMLTCTLLSAQGLHSAFCARVQMACIPQWHNMLLLLLSSCCATDYIELYVA